MSRITNLDANHLMTIAKLVDVELLRDLDFPNEDVFENSSEIGMRELHILHASKLAHIGDYTVRLIFEDTESLMMVEAQIWALTRRRIVLQKGVVVPVHRIRKFTLYKD